MKTIINRILFLFITAILLTACSSTQSLQEYYIDNTENPNFLSFDVPASILNLEKTELTDTQREAVQSLKKFNILAFKKTGTNAAEFEIEKGNVKKILKNEKYTELMKMNTQYGKATVKYLGDEDAIDEVIVYGSDDSKGFALVRVLGDDMNPAHMMQLLQAIQKSDYKGEGLDKIGELFKN